MCTHKTSKKKQHFINASYHSHARHLTQYNVCFFKSFFSLQNPHHLIPWCISISVFSYHLKCYSIRSAKNYLIHYCYLWIPNGKSNWPVYALLLLLKMRHKSSNVKVKRRISHWKTELKNLAPSIHAMPMPMPMCCCCVLKAILSTVNSHTYCRPLTFCHFTNWNCRAMPS